MRRPAAVSKARPAPAKAIRRGRPAQLHLAEERRQKLVAAALAVISRDGLAATSTRAVAKEAGVNVAMLHYSFDGKDTLLWAVLEATLEGVGAILKDACADAVHLDDAIRKSMAAYWRHIVVTPGFQRAQYELTVYALSAPGGGSFARKQYLGYVDAVVDAWKPLCNTNSSINLRDVAATGVAAMDGLILQFLSIGDRKACERQLEMVIGSIQALCRA